ncbi:hypothetical protein H5410_046207 [Solanum commersonii]|uniref:Uncharacterized protein n=1 Tax=Solanum commersonii TaxID=4109 RepID=A0A9J5XDQ8_SOLCO|nr:hypothetical protein H5410_046207 [Solanum commersonii]
MLTHSLGHQSSGLGFTTSLSSKPKTHGWPCICNYKPIKLNQKHKVSRGRRITWRLALFLSHHRFMLAFSIFTFWSIGKYSTASQNYSAKCQLLLSSPFLSFYFRASRIGTKGGLRPFGKSSSGVSKRAAQHSIMNAHNKTQFITYARINCVLKDSSCDTPLSKILMLAILDTCASSSSTKSI